MPRLKVWSQVLTPRTKFSFSQKRLEIGRVFVEALPDALRKDLGVVVFVKEILKEVEELWDDAMRALWLPEFGEAGVFILGEPVLHQAEILDGAGKDELVDEKDDGLGGLFGRRPFDFVELVEPDFQVFKKLLLQFRLFRRVLRRGARCRARCRFRGIGRKNPRKAVRRRACFQRRNRAR